MNFLKITLVVLTVSLIASAEHETSPPGNDGGQPRHTISNSQIPDSPFLETPVEPSYEKTIRSAPRGYYTGEKEEIEG